MRNKFLKSIAVVLGMVVFAAFALGSGSSGKESTSQKVGEVETQSEENDSKNEDAVQGESSTDKVEAEVSEENDNTEQSEYHVGDTFKNNGLSITYVSSSNYISDNEFMQPGDGNKYIRLEFYVSNNSGSDQSVSVFSFKCYADGYDCNATYFDDDISLSLSDGRTGSGAVYFEIPENASDIEIEYELNMFTGKKVMFIFEGDKDSGFVPESTSAASENTYKVGDIIETNKLRISYLDAQDYVSDNMFLEPKEGNKYIYIELEVENLSDSDQSISFYSFECYADGKHCEAFYGRDDALSATLSAGRKAKGTVAFEVPIDAENIEIEFEDNVWTSSKIIFAYK